MCQLSRCISIGLGIPLILLIFSLPAAAQETSTASNQPILPWYQNDLVDVFLLNTVVFENHVILETGDTWVLLNDLGITSSFPAYEVFRVTRDGINITSEFPEVGVEALRQNVDKNTYRFAMVGTAVVLGYVTILIMRAGARPD